MHRQWWPIVRFVGISKQRKPKPKAKLSKNDIAQVKGSFSVSNTVGSTGDKGSKKAYWEKNTTSQFSACQISHCKNPATVGGHVWIKGFQSTDVVYILPMCQVCTSYSKIEIVFHVSEV